MINQNQEEISQKPDVSGSCGVAWSVDLAALRRAFRDEPDSDGTVAVWIVDAPWAHPLWHSYAIVMLHLRPLSGASSPNIYLEGATHEVWVQALNPDVPREPAIRGHCVWSYLTPLNFGAQFIDADDGAAIERVHRSVQMICDGTLSPDTDYVRHWIHLYGDNMIKYVNRSFAVAANSSDAAQPGSTT
ncbi:MAG: hypothetical protein HOO99_04000 [Hyphomicrobiaceae bacterium]|nr:hypothetical protein [Hyphomicrobiaceae bacterium]